MIIIFFVVVFVYILLLFLFILCETMFIFRKSESVIPECIDSHLKPLVLTINLISLSSQNWNIAFFGGDGGM